MARQSFPYSEIPIPPSEPFPNGQTVRRPLLRVKLRANTGTRLSCTVCVDSGADQCIFPLSYALSLGLNPTTMTQQLTSGLGSEGNVTFYEEIEIAVGKRVALARAGFTEGLEIIGLGLLGQTGFFDQFTVTFDHRAGVFHVE